MIVYMLLHTPGAVFWRAIHPRLLVSRRIAEDMNA